MILLIAGLALWWAVHLFKRLAPDARARLTGKMGEASKGVFALGIVVSVVLMVIGYRGTEFIPVWQPPAFLTHVNNLLMIGALYTYGASGAKGAKVWLGTKLRHPQLTGFSIWTVAHLLVNGDLAAMILFGSLLVWAIVEARVINAAEGSWEVPPQAPFKKEIVLIIITAVLFVVVTGVHSWLGVWPFGG